MDGRTSDALRRIAGFLDRLPDLPDHLVTVYSPDGRITLLFGAGPDERARVEAVRRVLTALGGTAEEHDGEFGGTAALGPYPVEVSTGFD